MVGLILSLQPKPHETRLAPGSTFAIYLLRLRDWSTCDDKKILKYKYIIYILPCINAGNIIQELCQSTNLTFMIFCLTYCGACITRSSCTLFILYKSCEHTCEALVLNFLFSFKVHHSDIFVGIELNEILLLSIICPAAEK